MSVSDPLLEPLGFNFTPSPPFSLDVGDEASVSFPMTLSSFEDCINQGGTLQLPPPINLLLLRPTVTFDNVMSATWDLGEVECTAQLICQPPVCQENAEACPSCIDQGFCPPCDADVCTPPDENEDQALSRTMGFFKTHPTVLSACLAGGAVDLGEYHVSSLVEAMGLLWGSPERFYGGAPRGDLDRARFFAARQVLAGVCNQRLFAAPIDSLMSEASSTLRGNDCAQLSVLERQLGEFADAGNRGALPDGFPSGAASPETSRDLGIDPTTASGRSCK
jgi:hypothetical protein